MNRGLSIHVVRCVSCRSSAGCSKWHPSGRSMHMTARDRTPMC